MQTIKALVVKDYGDVLNYATMIEQGIKSIETRTWQTRYTGPLLICCSQSSNSENKGLALCVVELLYTRPMKAEDTEKACCAMYPGAFSWVLKFHRKLSRKFIYKKHTSAKCLLGLFDVQIPDDVILTPTNLF